MKRWLLGSTLFLAACSDAPPPGPPAETLPPAVEVARGPVREVAGSASCRHLGYCMTCAPALGSLKLKCGFKLSSFCPGRQDTIKSVQDVTYSQGGSTFQRTETISERVTGACR